MVVRNNQGVSITGIIVNCPASYAVANCVLMDYQSNLISVLNLVPPGGTAVGTSPVSSSAGAPFVDGTIYDILVQVFFSGGSEITLDISVTASS